MPPKKIKFVCRNVGKKLKQGELRDQPGNCFKKGIRVGFATGLNKALKKQAKIKPILEELRTNRPRLRATQQPAQAQAQRPSLRALIENRPNKQTRVRDFLSTLPIRNPQFRRTTREKKAMGTERLTQFLINSGEYRI